MAATKQSPWCSLLALALTASSANCGSLVDSLASDSRPFPNEVDQPPVQNEAVVPALLPLIAADGLFRFPSPNVAADDMSLDSALVQSAEYLFYALNIFIVRGTVEGQRGAFIDLPTLISCRRPLLSPSAYERPPDSLHAALRVQLGSYWRIPFCGERRTPEVVVSVATLANNARYHNGKSVGDTTSQNFAFRVVGVPWEWKVEYMVTPEEAVNEVYAVTGARAGQLPDLITAGQLNGRNAGTVWCPVWRVTLDRVVRMAAVFSLRRLDLAELYVGDSQCPGVTGRTILLTPMPDQPVSREFVLMLPDPTEPTGFRRLAHVARYRAPVNFESVVIEK